MFVSRCLRLRNGVSRNFLLFMLFAKRFSIDDPRFRTSEIIILLTLWACHPELYAIAAFLVHFHSPSKAFDCVNINNDSVVEIGSNNMDIIRFISLW